MGHCPAGPRSRGSVHRLALRSIPSTALACLAVGNCRQNLCVERRARIDNEGARGTVAITCARGGVVAGMIDVDLMWKEFGNTWSGQVAASCLIYCWATVFLMIYGGISGGGP